MSYADWYASNIKSTAKALGLRDKETSAATDGLCPFCVETITELKKLIGLRLAETSDVFTAIENVKAGNDPFLVILFSWQAHPYDQLYWAERNQRYATGHKCTNHKG
jgi:hypothetical protein